MTDAQCVAIMAAILCARDMANPNIEARDAQDYVGEAEEAFFEARKLWPDTQGETS